MNKKVSFLLLISSLVFNAYSQNEKCSCKEDLIYLDKKVRKTPSYKINKKSYQNVYTKVLEKANSASSLYDCHIVLNALLLSINDNHSRVYSIDVGATNEIKSSDDRFTDFKSSEIFNTYPQPNIDLDSLKTVLKSKPKEDKEGIYYRKDYLTIGVYKSINENNYKAIVLDSENNIWSEGEIIYTLLPFGNDYLLSLGGSLSSKRLIAYTERIAEGFFHFMGFKKDEHESNYSSETLSDSTYFREEISNDITYLKIGSFNSWYPTLSKAEEFYESLEGDLTKSNLIIDLRNNGGGGDRNSDILYNLIKDYAKGNKVYVLINHRTTSNAEQFAHQLGMLDNVQLFGQKTNGALAYEIKDGSYTLPCGNFVAVLTSKKHSEYLQFESKGVTPDVIFDMDRSWIDQLNDYISKK